MLDGGGVVTHIGLKNNTPQLGANCVRKRDPVSRELASSCVLGYLILLTDRISIYHFILLSILSLDI